MGRQTVGNLKAKAMGRSDCMTRTILDNVRPTLHGMTPYVPGKPISEVQKEFGLTDIVKLASNENPLGPSPFALKAIQQALPELHRYPDGNSQILKEVLAAVHQVDMQAVLVGNGSDEVIKLVAETFLEPGDEVVMPTPSISENWYAAQLMAAKPVPVPLNEDFSYDLEAVLAAVTARTKLVFLCTPNNPTGTYIREPELAAFLERLPGHVLVMLDEAYHEYVEANDAADGISLLKQGYPVAVMRTFSKLYGLAGLRVG
jgi:histidinol-phosphate aminotransferase